MIEVCKVYRGTSENGPFPQGQGISGNMKTPRNTHQLHVLSKLKEYHNESPLISWLDRVNIEWQTTYMKSLLYMYM